MRAIAKTMILVMVAVMGLVYATSCSPEDSQTPTQVIIIPPSTGTKAVTIQITTSKIAADGTSAVQIVAFCTIGGNQAPNGLPVFFTSNGGDFSLNGIDPIDEDTVTRSVTINTVSGQAVIYLISSTEPGNANITATFASEVSDQASVEFVRTKDEVSSVELAVDPTTGSAPLTAKVEATVKDDQDNPLSGVLVRFRSTDDAAKFDRQKLKTDSSGIAATFVHNISKDTTIKATASGIQAQELISIGNDSVLGIDLKVLNTQGGLANADPVLINEQGQLLLQASVTGENGAEIPNVTVTFNSTDPSTTFSRKTPKTNTAGEADTTANGIRRDSIITAVSQGNSDSVTIKINNRPVPIITTLSGAATVGVINNFVFSAESSYDPEEPYGDKINAFAWTATLDTSTGATMTQTVSGNNQLYTIVVGDGTLNPASGDELKVFLTVTDLLGLQQTTILTITWP